MNRSFWTFNLTGFVLIMSLLLLTTGCNSLLVIPTDVKIPSNIMHIDNEASDKAQKADEQVSSAGKPLIMDETPSIGGVCLGELSGRVRFILGQPDEESVEEGGYYGESIEIWRYQTGTKVILGKQTGRVLEICTQSPYMKTNLGVQINDDAMEALAALRKHYQEHKGLHSEESLIGWFELEKGDLLIINFDAAKTDNKINSFVSDEDVVERITLTNEWFYE